MGAQGRLIFDSRRLAGRWFAARVHDPFRTVIPPIGMRASIPHRISVIKVPVRFRTTRLTTIERAVALPTPTGPPLAV